MMPSNASFWKWSLALALTAAATPLAGCTDGNGPPGDGEFISDSPWGGASNGDDAEASGGGGGSGDAPNGDAEKAIVEADVIQVKDNHLFALSQFGGLTVIDMTNPAQLSILGNYRVQGVPFEMYLRDGVVYAMFSSFGQWVCDAGYESCEYITSSHIEALDVSNPASITKIGSFDLPGEISDSRIVGDVLYAVSYENGYCWNCQDVPQTVVTSIDVASPEDIAVVDSVSFASTEDASYGWGRRSVTVTPDRMFIAGIEWGEDDDSMGHSTIQVVDISDPSGQLHVGASVEAKGQIESRWQMDEKDGVLRVISQPGLWENGVPTVQTFQIVSSDSLLPIASLDLVLPKPERLRSARFDGNRLYAITAEQTDPLFTVDVSDPAHIVQMGELELPGWIYHLEPRGDRLFALGFDNADPGGSMNVSLFDVSNMASPTLIQRVPFGGTWSWAPEDQDRIHKAFKIDDELGAIFVPFGAVSHDGGDHGCWDMESGIQIFDFTKNSLVKRGVAPLDGFARRALIHGGRLFSVSDAEVSAYDITNRDAPARLDQLAVTAWVNQSIRAGDNLVRISADWWTSAAWLDVVPANDPGRIEPLGKLDLAEVVGDADATCYGWGYFYGAQVFVLDPTRVALTWSSWGWYDEVDAGAAFHGQTYVVVVNVANPAEPAVEGRISLPFQTESWGYWSSLDGGKSIVQIGDRLVFRRIDHSGYGSDDVEQAWLEIVDLSNPAKPAHTATVHLPPGHGHSLLVKSGNTVLTSHWQPVEGKPGKVKFYLDRVFLTESGVPVVAPPLNVPGVLLSFDAESSHALTIDFQRIELPGTSHQQCNEEYGAGVWYNGNGACSYMQQTLKLVDIDGADVDLLDTHVLGTSFYMYGAQVTDSRVFAQGYGFDAKSSEGYYAVMAVGDIGGDEIALGQKVLPQQEYMWAAAAQGDHLVLASYGTPGIHVLDATDVEAMTIEKKGDVQSYIYNVTLDGDQALCAMGPYGLDVVDLD